MKAETSYSNKRISPGPFHIPFKEKLKLIPEVFGIRLNEEPDYHVIKKEGAFEIRRYFSQLRANVTLAQPTFDDFRKQAFRKLSAFIFGGNTQKKDIPMTAPVLEEEKKGTSQWTMSFILPLKYNLATTPRPVDRDITLEEVPEYQVATLRYKGNNTLETIRQQEQKLAKWLSTHAQLKASGNFIVAQYDAPFVMPFLKRNEIQIRVVAVL